MASKAHRWVPWRFGYWRCRHCGLIWLKNAASDRAARRVCPDREDD